MKNNHENYMLNHYKLNMISEIINEMYDDLQVEESKELIENIENNITKIMRSEWRTSEYPIRYPFLLDGIDDNETI